MQIKNDLKNPHTYQSSAFNENSGALEKTLKMLADETGMDFKILQSALSTEKEDNKDVVTMKKSVLKTLIDRIRIMRADRYTDKSWTRLLSALKKALPVSNDNSPSEASVTKAINNVLAGITGLMDADVKERCGSESDKKNVFINEANRLAAKTQTEAITQTVQASASPADAFSGAGFSDGTGTVIEVSL